MAELDSIFNAIYGQESGSGRNTSTSVTGARGGMQIQPATFAQYALPGEDINNPTDNIRVGKRILADLSQKAGGDPARIAVGYFSGPGNIAPPGSPTPYLHNRADPSGKTTASYVNDIINRLPSRPVTPTPGTTINSLPPGPGAGPGSEAFRPSPVIAPAPPAPIVPSTPTIGQQIASRDYGGAFKQLITPKAPEKPGEAPGKSPLQSALSALSPQTKPAEAPPALPEQQMAPIQDPNAGMAPASQQLLAQIMAGQKPLSWSQTPYGSGMAGPQQIPGTTLNSPDLRDFYA